METKDYQDELFYGWVEANDADDEKVDIVTYECGDKEWLGVAADVRLMARAFVNLYDYVSDCYGDGQLEDLVTAVSNQMAVIEVETEDGQTVLRF